MAKGRKLGSKNKGQAKYHEIIPDDHECMDCGDTKLEGARFGITSFLKDGNVLVTKRCNKCTHIRYKETRVYTESTYYKRKKAALNIKEYFEKDLK